MRKSERFAGGDWVDAEFTSAIVDPDASISGTQMVVFPLEVNDPGTFVSPQIA